MLNWCINNAIISSSVAGETKTGQIEDIQRNSITFGNYCNAIGDKAPVGFRSTVPEVNVAPDLRI